MKSNTKLEKSLQEYLGDDSKAIVYQISKNIVDVVAVSEKFKNISTMDRKKIIYNWIDNANTSHILGFVSTYTHQEAENLEINLKPTNIKSNRPSTWFELVNCETDESYVNAIDRNSRVVSFYSFKGGVGRTTALVHVAWILASRGKKVVMVDLDFEAPSLHQSINIDVMQKGGLVDYIYEYLNSLDHEKLSIEIADIIREIPVTKGGLFLIPAGRVDSDYISKVDDLRNLPINDYKLWDNFKEKLITQLNPDIILVDSRTGINIWGALTMLQISDSSIVFMNPTPQNSEGIAAILENLYRVGIKPDVVLSPVISGKNGRERALREWNKVYTSITMDNNTYDSDEENEEPLMIPFTTEIAMTDEYPNMNFIHMYSDIANLLDEESEKSKLSNLLASQERWKIIDSFNFSSIDAKQEQGAKIRELFQRTTDFDRFLDHSSLLIKGKKGTGKTQLYWTTLNHFQVIKELAHGRVDNVISVSGHGPAANHPVSEDFIYAGSEISNKQGSWESFWRAYALYRLIMSKTISLDILRNKQFEELKRILKLRPKYDNVWTSDHTKFLLKIALNKDAMLSVRDALEQVSHKMANNGSVIWLLYDDLDQDIPEYTQIQKEAISGLLSFALALENIQNRTIRTKIFLRTDIWHRLNFTNKSHFVGRDVELKWTREDFLRLSLRQAKRSGDFDDLVSKYSPISDIDQATEDTLEKSLELLWGIDRERGRKSKKVSRWIYERLTDANGSTFPRALIYLLEGAKTKELEYQRMEHIQAPKDRLFRTQSLNEGLIVASQKRCDELRQEYKYLDDIGFFKYLKQLRQITTLDSLEEWWKNNATDKFGTFSDFIDLVKLMGLASEYNENQWKFADLYVYGFEMTKVGKM